MADSSYGSAGAEANAVPRSLAQETAPSDSQVRLLDRIFTGLSAQTMKGRQSVWSSLSLPRFVVHFLLVDFEEF